MQIELYVEIYKANQKIITIEALKSLKTRISSSELLEIPVS